MLSCKPSSYGPYALHAFEHLASLGVHHLEVDLEQERLAAELMDEFGLKAASVVGKFPSEVLGDLQALRGSAGDQADRAVALGTKVVFASVDPGSLPEVAWVEALRVVGDEFEARGVTLSIETHPPLAFNGQEAARTLQLVDHPRVKLNFDTANVYYYNEGPVDALQELSHVVDDVASVHLKDTDGGYHSWHFPALGDGVVDFPGVFAALNAAGFHGPFTLEIEGVEGETPTLELVKGRVEASVEYLRLEGLVE